MFGIEVELELALLACGLRDILRETIEPLSIARQIELTVDALVGRARRCGHTAIYTGGRIVGGEVQRLRRWRWGQGGQIDLRRLDGLGLPLFPCRCWCDILRRGIAGGYGDRRL